MLDALIAKIRPIQAFSLLADLIHLARRDPPIAQDGLYDWQARDDAYIGSGSQGHSSLTNIVNKAEEFAKRATLTPDPKVLVRLVWWTTFCAANKFIGGLS